jgi:DNA-binding transcriptional LysR family regulator
LANTIAMNASIAHWLAAPLIHTIAQQAPNITLRFVDWTQLTPKQLESGQVHYGINYCPMDLTKSLVQKKAGEDRFVFACRKDHPLSHRRFQLQDFERYAMAVHVIQAWNDKEEHITRLLKSYSLTPKIQLRATHMNILLQAIKHTDILFPCSRYLAMQLGEEFTYVEVEEGLPHPEGNFGVVYGLKWRGEQEIQWLDGVINTVIEQTLAKS